MNGASHLCLAWGVSSSLSQLIYNPNHKNIQAEKGEETDSLPHRGIFILQTEYLAININPTGFSSLNEIIYYGSNVLDEEEFVLL